MFYADFVRNSQMTIKNLNNNDIKNECVDDDESRFVFVFFCVDFVEISFVRSKMFYMSIRN